MKHILFIVSEDWYFVSHRLHLATTAIEQGFSVTLLTNVSKNRSLIEASGVKVIEWRINRSGLNVFLDIKAILRVFQAIRHCNPDIIHAVAMNEQTPEGLAYFLESEEDINKAIETAKYDYPTGTTTAQMIEDLDTRAYRTQ